MVFSVRKDHHVLAGGLEKAAEWARGKEKSLKA